jgi:hypothetical protein
MEAVLHGAGGHELATGAVIEIRAQASGCGCGSGDAGGPVLVQAYLADVAEGTALSIRKEGKTLWRRTAKKGRVTVSAPKIRPLTGDQYAVEWRATVPGGAQDTWVRYSVNDGKTWTGAAVGVTGAKTTLDARFLPSGKLLIEVVVHDGWRSVRSKPVPLENPDLPPVPAVLSPAATVHPLPTGDVLCLWGSVACQPGKAPQDYEYEWRLDGKVAGAEMQVFTRVPKPGTHRCEFIVRGKGKTLTSATTTFTSAERTVRQ